MKIIIAGSRSLTDYALLKKVMKASNAISKITEVVSGGAKGIDKLGEQWGRENKIPVKVFPALWNKLDVPGAVVDVRPGDADGYYNSRAGLQRNEQMGDYADALIAVWDGKSTGTLHMINYMKKLGKKVYIYNAGKEK